MNQQDDQNILPLVLIVGDVTEPATEAFVIENRAKLHFVRVSEPRQPLFQLVAGTPVVAIVQHAPPGNDAFFLLRSLSRAKPGLRALAIVLAEQPIARTAEMRALGVREIISQATASVEDFACAVENMLEICDFQRRIDARDRHANLASASLREADERFGKFMDALPGAAWIKDLDGRYVYVNRGVCQAFGAPAEFFIGRRVEDLMPDYGPEKAAHERRALECEQGVTGIEPARLPDGEKQALITRFAIRDTEGAAELLGGLAIDVSPCLWQFIEKSPLGAAMFDRNMRLLAANRKWWRTLGVAAPIAVGRPAREISCPFDLDWGRIHADTLAGKISEPRELTFEDRDGTRWLRWSAYSWTDHNGLADGVMMTVEEVTEAKRIVAERQALEEHYRSFFENAAFGAAEISAEGRIIRVNDRLCQMGGYEPKDLMGRFVTEFVHPDARAGYLVARWAQWQGDEKAFAQGVRYLRKDGVYRHVRITGKPVRDASGKALYATGVIEDITDQIDADTALRESEKRFRAFFNNGVFGAIEVSVDGVVAKVNKSLCDMGGWSEADLVGHSVEKFFHPECWDDFTAARASYLRGDPGQINRAWQVLRKDGSIAWLRLRLTLIRDEDGSLAYSCGIVEDMTEVMRAENALRDSEERYRAFFDNGAFGAMESDLFGRLTKVNRFMADLGGYEPEGMIGRSLIEFVHPDDRELYHDILRKLSRGDLRTTVEERRFRRKNGDYTWVRFRPMLLRDANGAPAYLFAIAEDISEELKAENALRESEERLRKLSDNIPNSAVYTATRDADGMPKVSYISAGMEGLTGVPPEEIVADETAFLELTPLEYRQQYLSAITTSVKRASDLRIELPITRRDGAARWIQVHSRPTRLQDGGVVWDGVLSDITERKLAEIALERNEARLVAVLDGAQDGILSFDAKGEIQSVNAAGAAMLGYGRNELIGHNVAHLCAACPGAICQENPFVVTDTDYGRPRNADCLRKDIATFPVEIRTFRSHIDDAPLYVSFFRDLSERRDIEARMESLKQQRLAAMGGMAAALAHELNQPLAAVALQVETARRLSRMAPEDRPFSLDQALDDAVAQTLRAGEIISHLRQFAARGEPDKTSHSLHVLLREVCAAAPVEGPGRIDLRFEAVSDIVLVDKVQIKQVAFNLIRNAFDAMTQIAEPVLTIATRNGEDNSILVDFIDAGHGICETIKGKLFEPLVTGKAGGMGIGLSLSRAIAANHSGGLNVAPNADQGVTFTLMLPLHALH